VAVPACSGKPGPTHVLYVGTHSVQCYETGILACFPSPWIFSASDLAGSDHFNEDSAYGFGVFCVCFCNDVSAPQGTLCPLGAEALVLHPCHGTHHHKARGSVRKGAGNLQGGCSPVTWDTCLNSKSCPSPRLWTQTYYIIRLVRCWGKGCDYAPEPSASHTSGLLTQEHTCPTRGGGGWAQVSVRAQPTLQHCPGRGGHNSCWPAGKIDSASADGAYHF